MMVDASKPFGILPVTRFFSLRFRRGSECSVFHGPGNWNIQTKESAGERRFNWIEFIRPGDITLSLGRQHELSVHAEFFVQYSQRIEHSLDAISESRRFGSIAAFYHLLDCHS